MGKKKREREGKGERQVREREYRVLDYETRCVVTALPVTHAIILIFPYWAFK